MTSSPGPESSTRAAMRRIGKDPLFWYVYGIFGIGLTALLFAIYAYVEHFGSVFDSDQEGWGQFGDYLGGTLNPLLSFLSLVLFVISLLSQRLELKEAREQMAEQAKENATSAHLNALSTALDATNAMIATPFSMTAGRDRFMHETAVLRREAILKEILTTVDVSVPLYTEEVEESEAGAEGQPS
ncbi:MAG TPA: hypothetical protein VF800_30605 [Telluria sp.]